MKSTISPLLFSLKPCYADLIFQGRKMAELRKRITSYMENRDVFIYVSSPVRQLRGGFRVGQVWRGSPNDIWRKVSGLVSIDKQVYDSYYAGKTIAYALEITDVWECENPMDLYTLREQFPNFVVPQSWRYVRSVEHGVFLKMKNQTMEIVA